MPRQPRKTPKASPDAKLPWAAFAEGTDKGETRAKPEIWTDQAKFNEDAEKLQAETAKLPTAAKTGNLDNIKALPATARHLQGLPRRFRKE